MYGRTEWFGLVYGLDTVRHLGLIILVEKATPYLVAENHRIFARMTVVKRSPTTAKRS